MTATTMDLAPPTTLTALRRMRKSDLLALPCFDIDASEVAKRTRPALIDLAIARLGLSNGNGAVDLDDDPLADPAPAPVKPARKPRKPRTPAPVADVDPAPVKPARKPRTRKPVDVAPAPAPRKPRTTAVTDGGAICQSCAQHLPMTKFPTKPANKDGVILRADVCRACRDAAAAARKAARDAA